MLYSKLTHLCHIYIKIFGKPVYYKIDEIIRYVLVVYRVVSCLDVMMPDVS